MSYSNYKRGMQLAEKCKYFQCGGRQSNELIEKVEKTLNIVLSKQHKDYFTNYGYVSFEGNDFYGIYDKVFEGIYAGNAVIATVEDRKEYGLPNTWIPIYDFDDGYVAYFDYENKNDNGEPRIILGMYNGKQYEISEIIAEDFGDFLIEMVKEYLKS